MAIDKEVDHLRDCRTPQQPIDTELQADEGCCDPDHTANNLQTEVQITTPLGLEEVDIIGIDGKENPADTEDLEVRCSRHPLIPVEEVIEGISQHDQRHHQRTRELE